MGVKNIKRFGSVSAPFQLALKSPTVYLKAITNVNPAWGKRLASIHIKESSIAGRLWAGAVAVANACRISEVLRIRACNIQPNGMAWVEGSKGSNARFLYLGIDPATAAEFISLPGSVAVFPGDYQHVYRACLAFGFAEMLPGHQHQTVTHAGRYRLAQQIAAQAGEVGAGQVLGHRSTTAVQYYVHPGKCKKKITKKYIQTTCQNLEDLLDLL